MDLTVHDDMQQQPLPELVDQYVVNRTKDESGLEVRHAATGEKIREMRPEGGRRIKLHTVQIAGTSQLGVASSPINEPYKVAFGIFDPATGRSTWRNSFFILDADVLEPRIYFNDQTVVAASGTEPGTAVVYSLHTGDPLWEFRGGESAFSLHSNPKCKVAFQSAGNAFVDLSWCPNMYGFGLLRYRDLFSGRLYWERPVSLPTEIPPYFYDDLGYLNRQELLISEAGDVAFNNGQDEFFVYSRSGRLLRAGKGAVSKPIRIESMLYVTRSLAPADTVASRPTLLEAIDVNTERVAWKTATYARGFELWSGRLIGMVSKEEWPLPAFLEQVDIKRGRPHEIPLGAVEFHIAMAGVGDGHLATWEETGQKSSADGLNITVGRLTVYAQGSREATRFMALGGAFPSAWPNACATLPHSKLSVAHRYTPVPRRRSVFGVKLPQPAACTFVPDRGGAPTIRVSVEWTAPTESMAKRLMASRTWLARMQYQPIYQLGPRRIAYVETPPSGHVYAAYVRKGSTILRITTAPNTPTVVRHAAALASGHE
ncbi:PQQ-binding-like beta-propeller repeat protein [Streptomyces sp. NPDC019443]|uniref:outer membrane protein assembly factor BamB family protein n=1 Tax=Streptomyces sp. NPDC019443 TaxID=3365061 RepID=UPI00379AC72B